MRSPVRASILPDRGRATASGDPVGGAARLPPIPIVFGARWIRSVRHHRAKAIALNCQAAGCV